MSRSGRNGQVPGAQPLPRLSGPDRAAGRERLGREDKSIEGAMMLRLTVNAEPHRVPALFQLQLTDLLPGQEPKVGLAVGRDIDRDRSRRSQVDIRPRRDPGRNRAWL